MHRQQQAPYKRPWVPLAAIAALLIGCFHPVWELMLPEINPIFGKLGYSIFLITSFLLLRLPPTCEGVKSSAWWYVDAILCTYSFVPLLQLSLHLPRPEGSPITFFYGFPSGHSVALFSLAFLVHKSHPRWSVVWFAAAVGLALTRINSLYHFPYQVFGGALLGLLLGYVISRLDAGIYVPLLKRVLNLLRLDALATYILGTSTKRLNA